MDFNLKYLKFGYKSNNNCDENPFCNAKESGTPAYILFVFGVISNTVALFVLFKTRKDHKWLPFYILFLGLAVTDCVNQCVVFPFVTLRYSSDFKWRFHGHWCDFSSVSYAFTQMASGIIIFVMALERYLFTSKQQNDIQENGKHSWKSMKYVLFLFVIWVFSAVISCIHFAFSGSEVYYPGSWCFIDISNSNVRSQICAIAYSVVGLIVILLTVILNAMTLYMSCRNPVLRGNLLDTHRVTGYHDIHVNAFLVIALLLYVIFWGPFLVDIILHATDVFKGTGPTELWFVRLIDLKSNVNPWLYVLLRKECLQKISQLCQRRKQEKRGVHDESQKLITSQC